MILELSGINISDSIDGCRMENTGQMKNNCFHVVSSLLKVSKVDFFSEKQEGSPRPSTFDHCQPILKSHYFGIVPHCSAINEPG